MKIYVYFSHFNSWKVLCFIFKYTFTYTDPYYLRFVKKNITYYAANIYNIVCKLFNCIYIYWFSRLLYKATYSTDIFIRSLCVLQGNLTQYLGLLAHCPTSSSTRRAEVHNICTWFLLKLKCNFTSVIYYLQWIIIISKVLVTSSVETVACSFSVRLICFNQKSWQEKSRRLWSSLIVSIILTTTQGLIPTCLPTSLQGSRKSSQWKKMLVGRTEVML